MSAPTCAPGVRRWRGRFLRCFAATPHPSRHSPCHLLNYGAIATGDRPIYIRCALQHPRGEGLGVAAPVRRYGGLSLADGLRGGHAISDRTIPPLSAGVGSYQKQREKDGFLRPYLSIRLMKPNSISISLSLNCFIPSTAFWINSGFCVASSKKLLRCDFKIITDGKELFERWQRFAGRDVINIAAAVA